MAERIVLCTDCGQKNRIGQSKGTPRCGACKKPLAIDSHNPDTNIVRPLKWVAGLALLGLIIYHSDSSDRRQAPTNLSPPERVQKFTAQPVVAGTGVVSFTGEHAIAPLKIKTARGYNYFVRIVSATTESRVMEVYIIGGDKFNGKLPLGSYEIRYASGETWYGPTLLFGPTTAYSKANRIFNFVQTGNRVKGYTIELIRQPGGNLRTSSISANDF